MGIKRTLDMVMYAPPEEARRQLAAGLEELGAEPSEEGDVLVGRSKRSLRKNRWAGEIRIRLEPKGAGTVATCTVDMAGDKHYAIVGELMDAVGMEAFDDQGVAEAVARLDRVSKLFGRKELRHLPLILEPTERVEALAQGEFAKKQGIIILTTQRLVFFEKSLMGRETLEEFHLASVSSLSVKKGLGGEKLVVHASGHEYEIKRVMHGQIDGLMSRFRALKHGAGAAPAPAAEAASGIDPMTQIERLGELRTKGLISDEEYESKKQELLGRL